MTAADVALAVSVLALLVAIVSAVYARRTARAHERQLRGETDPGRTARFELEVPTPWAFAVGEGPVHVGDQQLVATNLGPADAYDVELIAIVDGKHRSERSEHRAPGARLTVTLGQLSTGVDINGEVSWRDGRRRRQRHRRRMVM